MSGAVGTCQRVMGPLSWKCKPPSWDRLVTWDPAQGVRLHQHTHQRSGNRSSDTKQGRGYNSPRAGCCWGAGARWSENGGGCVRASGREEVWRDDWWLEGGTGLHGAKPQERCREESWTKSGLQCLHSGERACISRGSDSAVVHFANLKSLHVGYPTFGICKAYANSRWQIGFIAEESRDRWESRPYRVPHHFGHTLWDWSHPSISMAIPPFLLSSRHLTIPPLPPFQWKKWAVIIFPEGNFRFMTSYPLLGRIADQTVLHFVDRTRLTARSGLRRGIGNNLCGTIYVFNFRRLRVFQWKEEQQQRPKESQIKVGHNGDQGRAAKILLHLAFLAVRQHCGHFTTWWQKNGYKWQEECFHTEPSWIPNLDKNTEFGLKSQSSKWRTFVFGQSVGIRLLEWTLGYRWASRSALIIH